MIYIQMWRDEIAISQEKAYGNNRGNTSWEFQAEITFPDIKVTLQQLVATILSCECVKNDKIKIDYNRAVFIYYAITIHPGHRAQGLELPSCLCKGATFRYTTTIHLVKLLQYWKTFFISLCVIFLRRC